MIKSLLVGAIAGAVVTWMYAERIRYYIDDLAINMRERAAARLEGAADPLESATRTVEMR